MQIEKDEGCGEEEHSPFGDVTQVAREGSDGKLRGTEEKPETDKKEGKKEGNDKHRSELELGQEQAARNDPPSHEELMQKIEQANLSSLPGDIMGFEEEGVHGDAHEIVSNPAEEEE